MTEKKKLKVLVEALQSIACVHLPEANKKSFWYKKTMSDCAEVLAEDTDIARHALSEVGIK
jgi:hypothetical protein